MSDHPRYGRNASIREAYAQGGRTCAELAETYGISKQRVNQIINAETYQAGRRALHDRCSYVYFVAGADHIKIGVAVDLARRLEALTAGCPIVLEFLGAHRGGREREAALHAQFALLRVHHEWFRDSPELRGYIATTCTVRELACASIG